MSPPTLTVTLTVAHGPRAGLEYELPEPGVYVLGRGAECHPRLPNELPYKDVSRRHCLVGLSPSGVWVLDLDSRNGTFVNGQPVGQLTGPDPPSQGRQVPAMVTRTAPRHPRSRHALRDGDVLALGDHTVLRVALQVRQPVQA